ncbi:hypothetical protein PAXRUDRAFT_21142 [Paxillus rubicundulus Ve08.2h10]|uniref:Uncharacterized protein n=1 Tax=Paxillus rubicundulus Ve08.2h10 TaxID=930991 RepID=A0A0D0BNL6_9AGAM|nr:hypothetical protein PAXRUDRAFT_21142 [Paxillus rubicundulus Ve08.2h10]
MSPSTTNDLSKWSDKQLHENEDEDDELFEKKSAERRRRTKARKEAERRMAEEAARRKVEEEAKRKAEVEAQRRLRGRRCSDVGVLCEMRAAGSSKARSCDRCRRLRNKCERLGDAQPSWQRKREEVMSPRARKKKARMKSPTVEDHEEDAEDHEAEENRDALGTLAEDLSAMVGEMRNMAADRRRTAEESHAQMERVLGTPEEIRGCLDLEFVPEEGSEEDFEEGEVVEAAEEREVLKGRNEEEEEVDESV